jgi:acetyl-CoA synthetase
VYIVDRAKDMVLRGGENVYCSEVETAIYEHPDVAEAAVVGRPDDLKGQALVAFVTVQVGQHPDEALRAQLKEHVVHEIGAIARPDDIRFTDALPKTRSGKIMRRLLRDIAAGKETVGDTTTLEDFSVLAHLREDEE